MGWPCPCFMLISVLFLGLLSPSPSAEILVFLQSDLRSECKLYFTSYKCKVKPKAMDKKLHYFALNHENTAV